MASSSEVLHCYDNLASLLARMLEQAVTRNWDQLPEMERQCASLVERLRRIEPVEMLDGHQRREVRRLITLIQRDQRTVLCLVRPQVDKLVRKMHELNNQNNLDRTYGLLP
jgi:flagellar protein FliT